MVHVKHSSGCVRMVHVKHSSGGVLYGTCSIQQWWCTVRYMLNTAVVVYVWYMFNTAVVVNGQVCLKCGFMA